MQVLVLVQRADGGVAGKGRDGDGVGVQGRGVVAEEAVDREGAADPQGRPAHLGGRAVSHPTSPCMKELIKVHRLFYPLNNH